MTINLTIDADTPQELMAQVKALASEFSTDTQEEKPKTARKAAPKTKAKGGDESVEKLPEKPLLEPKKGGDVEEAEAVEGDEVPSLEEVLEAVTGLINKAAKKAGENPNSKAGTDVKRKVFKALLDEFKVPKTTELPEDKRAEFIARANELLAELED